MTWLNVGIVLLVVLFFSLRVRTVLTWNQNGLNWRVSFFGIPLSPYRRRKKCPKAEDSTSVKKGRLSFLTDWIPAPELLPDLLEDILEFAKQFRKIHRIELVRVHYCSAGSDPYAVVVAYNRVGILLETLDSLLERRCQNKDLYVTMDFDAPNPAVDVEVKASVHILRYFTLLHSLTKLGSLYRSSRVGTKAGPSDAVKDSPGNPQ